MKAEETKKNGGGFLVFLSVAIFVFGLGFVSYEKSRSAYLSQVQNKMESLKTVLNENELLEIAKRVATDNNLHDNEIYDKDIYTAKAEGYRR